MRQRSSSSASTILIILIIVFTFPIWLTLGGVLFGVIAGLFGAMIGVIGGLFGALIGGFFALIALPFKILFGNWGFHDEWPFHFSDHTMTIVAMIILVALVMRRQRSAS